MRISLRFSLRTLLALTTIGAVAMGAWQLSTGWGILATVVSLAVVLVGTIGAHRIARFESFCGPFAWPSDPAGKSMNAKSREHRPMGKSGDDSSRQGSPAAPP